MNSMLLILIPLVGAALAAIWPDRRTRPMLLPAVGAAHFALCLWLMAAPPAVDPAAWLAFDPLARAILRDPEFLILDEATASVDTRTEEVIQNNLKELRGDRITLAIAHRLSTVRQCDEIVVIVDGVIVERGTHAELVGAGGVYAGLWQVQSGE